MASEIICPGKSHPHRSRLACVLFQARQSSWGKDFATSVCHIFLTLDTQILTFACAWSEASGAWHLAVQRTTICVKQKPSIFFGQNSQVFVVSKSELTTHSPCGHLSSKQCRRQNMLWEAKTRRALQIPPDTNWFDFNSGKGERAESHDVKWNSALF